jgi:hypothetical protein
MSNSNSEQDLLKSEPSHISRTLILLDIASSFLLRLVHDRLSRERVLFDYIAVVAREASFTTTYILLTIITMARHVIDSFTKFHHIPVEIRLLTWGHALSGTVYVGHST